jgi:thiamine biosynthesis lipoprotein
MKSNGARPTDSQIAQARELVGSRYLELDESQSTIRFKRAGMMLDLGSIGKGYALDAAADVLRDAGVENALLHGGTSTIYALGQDGNDPWKVAIDHPALPGAPTSEEPTSPAAIVTLRNEALSVSAVWGKFFTLEGKTYGHVIDPRTGWPVAHALLGAVVVDSATDSDALSTIILLAPCVGDDVRSPSLSNTLDLQKLKAHFPSIRYLQASLADARLRWTSNGIEFQDECPTKQG